MGTPSDTYTRLRVSQTHAEAVDEIVQNYRKHRAEWGHTDAIEMVAQDLGVRMRTLYRWFTAWPEILTRLDEVREELAG
jgi:hypothetical protein